MHRSGKKRRGLILSTLCLALTLLFSGCSFLGIGGSGASPTTKAGKAAASQQVYTSPIILLNGSTDLTTLDPALAYDQSSLSAISMIYTGLVQLDDHMQVQPQLAKSWEVSDDGLTWTFHLRPNLTFSDGTPLTANDVAYSIDRALQPATKSSVSLIYLGLILNADKVRGGRIPSLIGDGNGLQVVDPSTLKIVITKKAPYFLNMLANTSSYVVEKKLIDTYGANFTDHLDSGGGDGPFTVKTYTHGSKIVFVPNTHYYGNKPQLRQVTFPFYTQQEVAYNDYAIGKVDTAGVPLAAIPDITSRPDYHQVPQLWINYYTMNYKVAPFDDINIRQAFALALDKTAIAKDVWKNTVTPTNHIVPEGMEGYNAKLTGPDGTQGLSGNDTRAKALLAQGMKDKNWTSVSQIPPITLTYISGSTSFDKEVHSMIQMWQKVLGITVTASAVDSDTLLEKVAAATGNALGLQMWGLSWVGEYPDPQNWLSMQFSSDSVYNNMNYGNNASNDAAQQQATQKDLSDADGNIQTAERFQTYQKAEQQLVNDVAWLPIEQVSSVFLRKPYVVGMVDNSMGLIPPNDWASIYILQH